MSKLDVIILEYGNKVLDLRRTGEPIGKPTDEANQAIKDLMLELLVNAVKADEFEFYTLKRKIGEL